MLSLRLNKKFEIRAALPRFIDAIKSFDWLKAGEELDSIEANLIAHFLSRSHSLDELRRMVDDIRYYLSADIPDEARYRGALNELQKLTKHVTPKIPEDPFRALEYLYDVAREDWAGYWESESPQGIQAFQDDLDEIRKLEPKFRTCKEDEYKQFREILKSMGSVSASLASLKGRTTEKVRENLFSRVQELFSNIETLMAPKYFKFVEKPEVKGIGGGGGEPVLRAPVDLEDLMRGG